MKSTPLMKKFTPRVKEKKIVMDGLTRDQSADLGSSHSCLYRRLHCDIRKPTCRFEQHVVLSHRFDNYILLNSVFVQIRGKKGRCDSEKGDEMFAIVRQTMRTPSPTFIHLLTLKENHPAARPRCNGAIIFFIACLNVYKKAKKLNLETFYVLMDIR